MTLKLFGKPSDKPKGPFRPGFWRDRRGASTVEFAIIALPFFGLIMGCIELAVVLFAGVSLDLATAKASREIRTGMSSKPTSALAFKTKVCAEMAWMGTADCLGKLQVDVRTYDNFNLVTNAPDPVATGELKGSDMTYTVGDGSKIQLVRAYYPWKLFSPFVKPGLSSLKTGEAVLTSKVVFKNEPF
ncbi:TadE/TadG family type IV pilus assembly protein [Asticcacaulis sp. AND118]|uniref:TadE/TadG family type IV pilus assembly protein n=1 Tax=Asticcacaulis sp. AND118 TaxID=2840468 RepID=UPI001CFFAAE6|nr:TadE/TadG family type IV pilus assembly protein [Asticcacaulis sp. AND118]UDF03755.1 pilus assembly protein [Asticcacaulis sp. AND118]